MDLSLWGTPSLQSQEFSIDQPDLEYLTNHVEESVAPETSFGEAGLQSTPEWLLTPQSWGKLRPSSFESCEARDELALLPSQKKFSRHRNSYSAVLPLTQSLPLKSAITAHRESARFRFLTCLQAPTAIVVDPDEAPESYLNKGQTYHLRVVDTTPPLFIETTKYRTFIRVSFRERGQRVNANALWRLWKERRGLAEVGKKDCELRAIEYASQNSSQMLVGQELLDGFYVTWTINSVTGVNECRIPIRFNFLSTDFTLAKGVRGISVQLCAKTDQIDNTRESYNPEICFCKIRVFRHHGAERKLASDIAKFQKRVQKLTAQINETATLYGATRKRKRGGVEAKTRDKLLELNNYEHHSSMNLGSGLLMDSYSDILQKELTIFRNIQISSCPENVLSLCGGLEDDPEMHIACLESEHSHVLSQQHGLPRHSVSLLDDTVGAVSLDLESQMSTQDDLPASQIHDCSRRTPIPVTYFYIYYESSNESSLGRCYHKIFLRERTARDLALMICEKCDIEASKVFRISHTDAKKSHLDILVDDEFVQQMTEGRDMIIKVKTLPASYGGGEGSGADAQLGIWLEY